jgi:hypothetical protein
LTFDAEASQLDAVPSFPGEWGFRSLRRHAVRTLTIIAGGFVLLGLFALLGHWTGRGLRGVLPYFAILWFAAAAANMWIGVTRAGYGVGEELPIFLLIFAVPVGAAWLLSRWLSPGSP